MALLDFDLNDVEANVSGDYSPVPAGWYDVVMIDNEIKKASSGGQYAKLTFEIVSGDCKGRKLFDNLNIIHSNTDTQRWAREKLAAIYEITGTPRSKKDLNALHNKKLRVNVKIKESDQYGPQNNITAYGSYEGEPAPTVAVASDPKPSGNAFVPPSN